MRPVEGAHGMQIVEGYRDLDAGAKGAAAAIGNFDGVHLGHRVLIRDAAMASAKTGGPVGVISFEPHPRRLFQPDAPPFRLTTQAAKARLLAEAGVDCLYNIAFDRALSAMTAEEFVQDVLHRGLGISHLVVGADFRFGKGRSGDATLLRAMGTELGFGVTVEKLVGDETGDYASTAIRVLVEQGLCADAARQLGRWHSVSGPVVLGDQRGRDLGYPTANLAFDEQLIPRYGVYATWVDVLDGPHQGRYPGVASIGERPTFGVNAPNFEVHLFDFSGDLYGAEISVDLVHYLRGEIAYTGVQPLIDQMDKDSEQSRTILASAQVPEADG